MFTAEEAIECSGTLDAIMLTPKQAVNILEEHGLTPSDLLDFYRETDLDANSLDAGELFIWLGY